MMLLPAPSFLTFLNLESNTLAHSMYKRKTNGLGVPSVPGTAPMSLAGRAVPSMVRFSGSGHARAKVARAVGTAQSARAEPCPARVRHSLIYFFFFLV